MYRQVVMAVNDGSFVMEAPCHHPSTLFVLCPVNEPQVIAGDPGLESLQVLGVYWVQQGHVGSCNFKCGGWYSVSGRGSYKDSFQ